MWPFLFPIVTVVFALPPPDQDEKEFKMVIDYSIMENLARKLNYNC